MTLLFTLFLFLHTCIKPPPRLLFLTPRTGGFNNQLITIYQGIHCARLTGRTVVLPLIYENVRADTSSKGFGPYPFEDYFDVGALKKVVNFATPARIDITGPPCRSIYFATSPHFKANARRVPRLLKQEYSKRWSINHTFVDAFERPVTHTCVDDSLCQRPDFLTFGAYSDYEQGGQGYNIRNSVELFRIRKAFKPSKIVSLIAETAMRHIETHHGKEFNALHLRRGDFESKCHELPDVCERFGEFSMVQSQEWVLKKVHALKKSGLPVFISTTHRNECVKLLQGAELEMIFIEDVQLPRELHWASERTDLISFASQIVCSKAQEFVGNRFSSYTTEINNMRYLRDRKDKIIFF